MTQKEWIFSLSHEELSEFVMLELGVWDACVPVGVLQDWIEEHDGDRDWCIFNLEKV